MSTLKLPFGRKKASQHEESSELSAGETGGESIGDGGAFKLILGLGNPGRNYEATRHNVGWWLLDQVAAHWKLEKWKKDFDTMATVGRRGARKLRLVKPLTYMNLSGRALHQYLRKPGFNTASDLLVVVDDIALPIGSFRLRAVGSSGGHNGLKSIEEAVGGQEYARLRIGINPSIDARVDRLSDFVLSPISARERHILDEMAPTLTAAVETWLDEGILAAMNRHNRGVTHPENPQNEE